MNKVRQLQDTQQNHEIDLLIARLSTDLDCTLEEMEVKEEGYRTLMMQEAAYHSIQTERLMDVEREMQESRQALIREEMMMLSEENSRRKELNSQKSLLKKQFKKERKVKSES